MLRTPAVLRKLIEKEEDEIEKAKKESDGKISKMLSSFNLLEGKPNISFYEGVEGVKKLYEDILIEKKDMLLIRSIKDIYNPELQKLLHKQRIRQSKHGIKIKSVGPVGNTVKEIDKEKLIKSDKRYFTERRILNMEEFGNESQIIIYGNKVAITSYDEHIITTIIESSSIKDTFKNIFKILWEKGKKPY